MIVFKQSKKSRRANWHCKELQLTIAKRSDGTWVLYERNKECYSHSSWSCILAYTLGWCKTTRFYFEHVNDL